MTHSKCLAHIAIAACLLAAAAVHAYGEHADPALKNLTQAFAEAAQDGKKLDSAFRVAEQTVKAMPNDPIALVYKGSLAAQRARAALMPWNKLGYLGESADLMDKALDIATAQTPPAPEIILEVRMVRAMTNARIPAIFGRGASARDDFHKILASPGFQDMDPPDQAAVYAWLAVYAHRDKQADKAAAQLERAQALDPATADTVWAKR